MVLQAPATGRDHPLADLGVAITQGARGGLHCGLMYRTDGQDVRVAHLAGHLRLRHGRPDGYAWQVAAAEPSVRRFVAAYLESLRTNAVNAPYGFDGGGANFDLAGTALDGTRVGKGLTCSTFVVAVLKAVNLDLLEGPWPTRAEDAEWQARILDEMRDEGADEAHLEAVRGDVGTARVRPEEVVGAALCPDWPVAFAVVEPMAARILEDLLSARSPDGGTATP